MTPQEKFVNVRGVRIRLLRAGSGEPLLYLHGLLGEVRWMPFFDLVSRHFTLYVPEHPGFGTSEGLERVETVGDLAFHYADLMDELGLERPHIAGLSLGGWIAAELAVHYVDRVRKLVLIDAMGLAAPGVAMVAMLGQFGQVTVNEAMTAKYAPDRLRGRIYAVRYFMSFAVAAFAVTMAARLHDASGNFIVAYRVLAISAAAIFIGALLFPRRDSEQQQTAPAAIQPAE